MKSLIVFSTLVFLFSHSAFASKVIGRLMVVKKKVFVLQGGKKNKKKKARVGMKVRQNDSIVTEKNSRAKVVMIDKNTIHISPGSEMNFEKYEFQPGKNKKNVLLNVIYGKVRSNVRQKYDGKKNRYQVKTKAAVAGVRGTDFLSSYSPSSGQSQFVTFEGMVEVGTPGPGNQIMNSVRVAPGQITTAANGAAPSPPQNMPKQQLAAMEQETMGDFNEGESNERVPANNENGEGEKEQDEPESEEKEAAPKDEPKQDEGQKEEAPKEETGPGEGREERGPDSEGNEPEKGEGNQDAKGPEGDGPNSQEGQEPKGDGGPGPDGGPDGTEKGPGPEGQENGPGPDQSAEAGSQPENGNAPKGDGPVAGGPDGNSPGGAPPEGGGNYGGGEAPLPGGPQAEMGGMEGDRTPSGDFGSGGPLMEGGMLTGDDLAGNIGGDEMMMPEGPDMPDFPTQEFTPPTTPIENCEFCQEVIENGPSRLIINIINQ